MYLLYSLIYTIALIIIFPFEYLKRPKDLRKRWLREKLGFLNSSLISTKFPLPPFPKGGEGGIIWIHAVSVGEVIAASSLLKRLKEKYPSKRFILSTITDTGQKVAGERAPEGTTIVYLPFDITFIMNRILKKTEPEMLIVIETELWPNFIRAFKEKGVPVLLLNGRISGHSYRGYRKISFFMKKVLSRVDFFGMQRDEYAERIRSLGADSRKIKTIGNFKFDTKPPSQIPGWRKVLEGPVIVAGSTHEGEEEFITSVYLDLKKDFQDLNLIIAPRHPERFKAVEEMLKSKDSHFIKRSAISAQQSALKKLKGILILLDTVGELSAVYGLADITIIGKSFRGHGGQNPLEPAYWGKPIVCGPHMENFPFIQDFYTEGAALEVREEELYETVKALLKNPEKAREIGLKAKKLYAQNAGAVERAMEVIERYISH